ncbi:MAG: glycosyltransferase family 39 protein [Anaerolineae bacterium]|nr:glycosyltransferase family 39 protein [Anaerolineae bacterium]
MRSRSWWLVVPVLLLVATFLLVDGWLLQMHPDEELSYRSTNGDLAYTLDYQMSMKDNQAPLWFVTFWVWRQMVGDAEYTSRVLGVLTILPTLALAYRLGRRWFRSMWAGLLAPLLLIGNGLFFNYALDIRPYPMVMLSATLSMWAYTLWLDRRTTRRAVLYGVTIALILYVHYLLIFQVVVQVIYFMLSERLRWRGIRLGVLAGAVGVGLWLPWLPTFINQVAGLRNIELESGTGRGIAGIGVSTQATTLPTIQTLLNLATNNLVWLYGGVLIVGAILLWRSRRYWLALAWAMGAPALYLLANLMAAVYAPRFVSHLMIGLVLALAAVLVRLPRAVRILGAAVLVGANLLTLPDAIPVRVPYRDVYRQVSAAGQAGDAVLNTPANRYDGFLGWQQAHYLAPALLIGITTDVEQAQAARRVWFMTGDWFNPAVRVQFAQLEPTHPVQQVIGQCPERGWCYLAQLMEAPPLANPQRFGTDMDFWGVDVDEVTHDGITTRLWWRVETALPLDYSISLRLVDGAGTVVAQNDGPIHHYGAEVVQTSQLEPGKIYIDWRTLEIPARLPEASYTLQLVVYQSWDGARLLLPDGSDALTLETLTIS